MRAFLICICTVFITSPVRAQPLSASDALSTRVKAGDTVSVLDSMSREVTGVYARVSGSVMTLTVDGAQRDIPLSEVRRVTRRGGDSLWNGLLLGAGVGALAGGLQGGRMALAGAALYGSIGAIIDSQRRGRVVVYRGPGQALLHAAPVIDAGRRGMQVALSF